MGRQSLDKSADNARRAVACVLGSKRAGSREQLRGRTITGPAAGPFYLIAVAIASNFADSVVTAPMITTAIRCSDQAILCATLNFRLGFANTWRVLSKGLPSPFEMCFASGPEFDAFGSHFAHPFEAAMNLGEGQLSRYFLERYDTSTSLMATNKGLVSARSRCSINRPVLKRINKIERGS